MEETPAEAPTLDVRKIIDERPLGAYQRALLCLCAAVAFADGYDLQALAVAAPYLSSTIGLPASQLGLVFAMGSVGGLLGGLVIAPLSDRSGRRPLLIACMSVAAVATLAYPSVTTSHQLIVLRFITGAFLAASITIVHAYSSEIAPRRFAASAVMIATAGFGIGVAVAGFASGWLINSFGWRSIFYAGGALTFLIVAAVAMGLPESVRLLALRPDRQVEIRRILQRLGLRDVPATATFILSEERRRGAPVRHVFSDGRLGITIALCASFFLLNAVIYVLMQWLPTLLRSGGADPMLAGLALGTFKLAGLVGSFICAGFLDRRPGSHLVLIVSLFLAAACLFVLAGLAPEGAVYLVGIAAVGLLLTGPQYAIAGLAARLYPTYVRVTGLAVTSGSARIGAICGPLLAGIAIEAAWSANDVFRIAALPTAMSAAILVALRMARMPSTKDRPNPIDVGKAVP
jgi:AAHS family 4-hydroxybenzoate transporter-like MFS transporter